MHDVLRMSTCLIDLAKQLQKNFRIQKETTESEKSAGNSQKIKSGKLDPKHVLLWKHPGFFQQGLEISLKLLKLLGEETILTDWTEGKGLWEVEEGGRFLSESVNLILS